jgi:hypothetical protein
VASDSVEAELVYLSPRSTINRRYVAPGVEVNTGEYESHRVQVRNGRCAAQPFSLDEHGFMLVRHQSAINDFFDQEQVQARYPTEVTQLIQQLTGADLVLPLGWMVRTAGPTLPNTQPPASEVHVDMTTASATRRAKALYERMVPNGGGYRRFLATSFWRPLSAPPQDWPLALCEAASLDPDEGVANYMLVVDSVPERSAMFAELPDAESLPAAFVFPFNPRHRWWYFPEMTRDEAILLKLHDSDHSRAWRTPHTAFRDPTVHDAPPRASIEFRTIAYFN